MSALLDDYESSINAYETKSEVEDPEHVADSQDHVIYDNPLDMPGIFDFGQTIKEARDESLLAIILYDVC
jgi:hypothetical protein